jgi:hypothetical protein
MDEFLTDGQHTDALSLGELKTIQDQIHGSADRIQVQLDRVEALIVAAQFREQRRVEPGTIARETTTPCVGSDTPTDAA